MRKQLYDGWTRDCALWGQVNLQEHEPARLDLDRWKDYWRRTHIDGVTLNAGGIIHYFETGHDWNWVSPWMNEVPGRDIFGEMVEAARQCDLYVLARFTPSRVHELVARSHPEWLITDADGQPVPDPNHDPGASVRMWYACKNADWYRHWIPEVMFGEVMERYDVDGFFFNAWQTPERTIGQDTGTVYIGPCHCVRCTRGFRDATGHEVPRAADWSDAAWRAWTEWHNDCMDDLARQYESRAKALKPHAVAVMNMGGDVERMNDSGHWRVQGQTLEMVDHDHQSRRGPIWTMGIPGRMLRATMDGTPYYHLFGVYGGTGRVSAQPDAELELITGEMMLAGCRLWYHVIGADGHDQRPFDAVARIFDFYHRNREYIADLPSAAQVAIVFSQRAADSYGRGEVHRLCGDPFLGVAHTLIRARIPFDLIEADDLASRHIEKYRTLILPNQAALSDSQCEAIEHYVKSGGGLVATFESGRYAESGELRAEFPFAGLFGVEPTATKPVGPIYDAHVGIEQHEVIGVGLEATQAVATGGDMYHVPVSLRLGAEMRASFIPPFPRMPPERSFFHTPATTMPLAVTNRYGNGRVVYFPCDIDRWCSPDADRRAQQSNPDHRRMLANAVNWSLGGPLDARVEGPGVLDSHVYRRGSELVVHMVNCTNADCNTPPAEQITPIEGQTLVIRCNGEIAAVRFLRAGVEVESEAFQRDGEFIQVSIPPIGAHEVAVYTAR